MEKGPVAVRQLILDKKLDVADLGSSSSFHMRNKLEQVTSKNVDNNNKRPDQLVLKKVVCNQPTISAESRKHSNIPNLQNGQTRFFLLIAGLGRHQGTYFAEFY